MTQIAMTDPSDDDDLFDIYDAAVAPDPEDWLAMDEDERVLAVRLHHTRHAPHPPAPSPHAHFAMHAVVETQIALGTPPATAVTLARLITEGLSRHEAVHAVAGAVARMLVDMMQRKALFDQAAYERDLAQISAASWLASADDSPSGRADSHRRPSKPRRRERR